METSFKCLSGKNVNKSEFAKRRDSGKQLSPEFSSHNGSDFPVSLKQFLIFRPRLFQENAEEETEVMLLFVPQRAIVG